MIDTGTLPSVPATGETPKPEPGTGHRDQSFLVGDLIYLRPTAKDDARYGAALRGPIYPVATALTEEWIKETASEGDGDPPNPLAVIRKTDDVVVGAAHLGKDGNTLWHIDVKIDRLHGARGPLWRAEAYALLQNWILEERQVPALITKLPATDTAVIEALLLAGWIETARHRQFVLVDGQRVDRVQLQAFNSGWLATLGHPMDIPLERTGTGQPRPVPPPVAPIADAPKNAFMTGKRVYLRALDIEKDVTREVFWTRRETETFFDIGRHLPDVSGMSEWLKGHEKKEPPDWVMIGVYLRENDEYIGDVMLIGLDLVNRTAETGSWFYRKEYRGSGYGSEAKQLLLEYAFDVLGLHAIESWVLFPNTRSAAALRKQGYKEAGRMCWAYPFDGGFNNGILFDLLAEEWRAMPREEWGS